MQPVQSTGRDTSAKMLLQNATPKCLSKAHTQNNWPKALKKHTEGAGVNALLYVEIHRNSLLPGYSRVIYGISYAIIFGLYLLYKQSDASALSLKIIRFKKDHSSALLVLLMAQYFFLQGRKFSFKEKNNETTHSHQHRLLGKHNTHSF